jgi:UDP-3-O-acyl-N-acetylglucosamine deacetylase
VAHRAGHALHTALVSRLLEERDAWALVDSPAVAVPLSGAVAATARVAH